MAIPMFIPRWSWIPVITPHKDMTAPTEILIFPDMMARFIPRDTMISRLQSFSRFCMLYMLAKPSANTAKKANTAASPNKIPGTLFQIPLDFIAYVSSFPTA